MVIYIIKKKGFKTDLYDPMFNFKQELINNFEVIILEVSLHKYNKDSPLFYEVISYMHNKKYILYDIYDLKRLGDQDSYLLQFDCVFLREDSNLLKVKFWIFIINFIIIILLY